MYKRFKHDTNGNGHGSSSSSSTTDDIRLHHVQMPHWQVGTKQILQGSDYALVEPTSKIESVPTQVEFELPTKKSILFGSMSKFRILGGFQKYDTTDTTWKNLSAGEAAKVLLAPFWFEMLIKEISVFHNNYKVATSSETRFIAPFLHAYLYTHMDPKVKAMLCPQLGHPGYCVPAKNEKWTLASEGYKEYIKTAFADAEFAFEYVPLFLFPFFQGPNFMVNEEGIPRILHMPTLGRIQIRFTFHDSQDHIFNRVVNNTDKYRFAFTEFKMIVEQARFNPSMERSIQAVKKSLPYPGVTRLQLVEQVPNSSSAYKTRFQDIVMPESIFIFCLDKTVASGTYKFSGEKSPNIFRDHNIQSVELSFAGMRLSIHEPHLGMYREDEMDSKAYFDYRFIPPFGIFQNKELLTHAAVTEGSIGTAFPHLYFPLVKGPDRQRIVPALDNGGSIMKKADLEIDFKFKASNSAENCIYCIYCCYTDVNMVYDNKNRVFYSPYLQYMN